MTKEEQQQVHKMTTKANSANSSTADIHFSALCNAIEHEKLEKARAILETHPSLHLDLPNNDGFTPLDLAFMTGNQEMLKLLTNHKCEDPEDDSAGRAIEGTRFPNPESASQHLVMLINQCKDQVEKFGQLIKSATIVGGGQLTPAHLKECEKQKNLWQKRLNGLKKLKTGLETSGRPHAPSKVSVEVTGPRKIRVKLEEPEMVSPHSLYTKFRVQWSKYDSFNVIHGESVICCSSNQGLNLECFIDGLEEAERYFIRASFGNPKGFGPYSASMPKSVFPSSWRSVQGSSPRIKNQLSVCQQLMLQLSHQSFVQDEQTNHSHEVIDSSGLPFKLLQLFSLGAAGNGGIPRLQRQVLPNKIYLGLVLFHEDRVLMTNEETMPLLYIDENNVNVKSELHWLSKLSYNWSEAGKLKHSLSKSDNGSFRSKLLNVIHALQTFLSGLHGDLGHAYHAPFYFHNHSSAVFNLVKNVRNIKSVVTLSLKWVPLAKALKSSSHLGSDFEHSDMLTLRSSIRSQMLFHQVSQIGLNRGLYLAYLIARSSIEEGMRVIVSNTGPGILPYVKVRDNPHVTSDEWRWITQLGSRHHKTSFIARQGSTKATSATGYNPSPTTNFLAGEGEEGSEVYNNSQIQLRPTEEQYAFGKLLQISTERLFDYLDVNQRPEHRIYDAEVIELSEDVNLILVLPPPQKLVQMTENDPTNCLSLQGRNDLMTISLHSFEVLHLGTYYPELLANYVKVANMIESETLMAKYLQKEAVDPQEVDDATSRLGLLSNQQHLLEECWKPVRWLFEILSKFRNRSSVSTSPGITFAALNEWYSKQTDFPDDTAVFAHPATLDEDLQQGQSKYQTKKSVIVNLSRTPTTRSDPSEFSNEGGGGSSRHNSTSSDHNQRLRQTSTYHVNASDHPYSIKDEPNILQVYAAYETGLASGTSVKLTVTKDTSAREVIDLVIKQLNMAVILKGREGPVYENDKLKNFCLVAVIGSRERCLRDDFRPLNLQNPWKSGKLFVRMKHDVLAALERIQSSSRLKNVENMSMSSSVPNMAAVATSNTTTSTSSSSSRPTTTVL